MASDNTPTDQGVAVAIAEAYLNVLSGGSAEQLGPCLGRSAEQLLMGEDGRPYFITVTGVRSPAGGLYLHVCVSDRGWDGNVSVVRSAVIPFGAHGRRRA
ncbi:hypothetical protein HC028_25990 [Planosporangium flavigriseum]|uniref:Uncharacterized protein n=1 Tax=Planosporangium flavigriseum TaxID=373681 RepID=A0A8J3PP51_9ACTN|nr:hypothetical protein [Planosporangium flavigriseum]NJC67930.1 hypothetical protein [Planosporangium flavigriseum]GIG76682.1 hypothetical protein Pfl04_50860 [Planosporangium flavigriseum]